MKKKLVILLMLLCTWCMPSFAASWYYLGQSEVGTNIYIDNSSVRKNYSEAIVWVKYVKPSGESILQKLYIYRKDKTYACMNYVKYDVYASVIDSYHPSYLNYDSIPPESVIESVYYAIWPY